jgi:hypothetical protein
VLLVTQPWFKFKTKLWRGHAKLRMCSLAARGLWVDLLSYMHEGVPYGHFLVDGKQPTLEQTASLVGRPIKEVRAAWTELEANGVFGVREDGAIFSRRMVEDKAREEKDKAYGKAGGNPILRPKHNGGVNPPDKAKNLELRTENSESKGARAVLDCRTKITRAFEEANSPNLPDTSRVGVWASQGYDLKICAAVIAELIAKKPSISSLNYFDNAIKDAHEKRRSTNGHAAIESEADKESRLRTQWDWWKEKGTWKFRGPSPDCAGCEIPKELIEKWSNQPPRE